MRSQARAPWLWALILIAVGVVLLLDNFLLIDLDAADYWPFILVVLAVQLLLRGDIGLSWAAHTFGITRGSVRTGSIEVESGEIDVQLRALRKSGRLVAGQYTARSRPALTVRNNQAHLVLRRGETWPISLADWDVGLADDLPWDLLISSYLGRLELDLRDLPVRKAFISSGLGNVQLACPEFADDTLYARSSLGDVRISIPEDSRAVIHVQTGPFGRVRVDEARFEEVEPGIYASIRPDAPHTIPKAADLHITASTTFGSIYLA
ncbi:MAG TPA: DUF5668 domain-containing protein [Aggregatilinea sp.]|jgi:hypothetical protein|uniref:LiaI-LiaF-like domain-containing protein n=1 Tax=Aggregatilinea sp. TaxID=2806333 RepID=UPI002C43FF5C|nr:DUF5668 domain-containing protein [Aggregatilinea sp.]HML21213.1 DUF5668 domain-containing protein [Aggregatilinea sp.]